MKSKKVLFLFYNRLQDPLLQSNIFQYLNSIISDPEKPYRLAIITYEDSKFPLSKQQKEKIKSDFETKGVEWIALKWHQGDGMVPKAIDIWNAFFTVLKLNLKGYNHAVSLGSIAGSFLYLISRVIPLRYYLYQYEPHSEYALDGNIWTKDSKQFKLLKKYENLSLKASAVISSGTTQMQQRLKQEGVDKPFYKITSVVNEEMFVFSEASRKKIRGELGISDSQKLIIYPGKIGGLYANEKRMSDLILALSELDPSYIFLIITPHVEEMKTAIDAGLQARVKIMNTVAYESMPAYLSAADLGVVSVLPGESQKYRSNIKVGEFLCTGLPYLVCKGVSEDDIVALQYNVGIVVNDFTTEEINKQAHHISGLVLEPKTELIKRCRLAGIAYRGFKIQHPQFLKAMQELTVAG